LRFYVACGGSPCNHKSWGATADDEYDRRPPDATNVIVVNFPTSKVMALSLKVSTKIKGCPFQPPVLSSGSNPSQLDRHVLATVCLQICQSWECVGVRYEPARVHGAYCHQLLKRSRRFSRILKSADIPPSKYFLRMSKYIE
jgi:hypothetical protein